MEKILGISNMKFGPYFSGHCGSKVWRLNGVEVRIIFPFATLSSEDVNAV
jgi:hypothetical protein